MKAKSLLTVIISMLLVVVMSVLNVSAVLVLWSAGDVDYDGEKTVKDATLIQKCIAGIVVCDNRQKAVADVDGDGSVTVKDATMIQKYCAGVIRHFPNDSMWESIYFYSFNADFDSGKAMVGVPVTFMVTASAAPEPLTYKYSVNGEVVIESTADSTFTYTFDEAGTYDVEVVLYTYFGLDFSTTISYQVVDAYESEKIAVKAFYPNKRLYAFNTIETDTVFTAEAMFGSGEYEYAFYMDGVLKQDFSTKNTYDAGRFKELREHTVSVEVRDVVTGDIDSEEMTIVVVELAPA